MNKRTKTILGLASLFLVVGLGLFGWAVKVGKIEFRAETIYTYTVSGKINNFTSISNIAPEIWFLWLPADANTLALSNNLQGIIDGQGNYSISFNVLSSDRPIKGVVCLTIVDTSFSLRPLCVDVVPIPSTQGTQSEQITINLTPSYNGHGYVFDVRDFSPISGATVTVTSGSRTEALTTNDSGYFNSSFQVSYSYGVSALKINYQPSVVITDYSMGTARFLAMEKLSGNLSGTVKDKYTQQPIEGATVSGVGTQTATTGSDGRYSFSDVSAGTYTLQASKADYKEATQTVTLATGETKTVDFDLFPIIYAVMINFDYPEANDYGFRITRQEPGRTEEDVWVINPQLDETMDPADTTPIVEYTSQGLLFIDGMRTGYRLRRGQSYIYRVYAFDRAGNESIPTEITANIPNQ